MKITRSFQSGFTLLEVMVVMGIIASLFAMGLFFDLTFYRGTSFSTDADMFASVLKRARSRAINNVNVMNQGIHITPDSYILFQGDFYGANPAFDQKISRNQGLSFSGPSADIIFTRLTGDSNFEGSIIISGYGKTAALPMNYEGLINR